MSTSPVIHIINNNSACGGAQIMVYDLLMSSDSITAYYLHKPKRGPIINHPRFRRLTFFQFIKVLWINHTCKSIVHCHLSYAFYLSFIFRPVNLLYRT